MKQIFPNTGSNANWSHRGYHRGTIVGRTAKGFIVQFSSGAEIEVYDDEIEFD